MGVRIANHPDQWGKQGFRTPHKVIKGVKYKYCPRCECWLNVDEFSPDKSRWDLKRSHCIVCEREGSKERHERITQRHSVLSKSGTESQPKSRKVSQHV